MSLPLLIRYASYPAVMLPAALLAVAVASGVMPAWPTLVIVAACGIALVAALERRQPYEAAWLHDHGDARADVWHGVVNLAMLATTAYVLHALRDRLPIAAVWPVSWLGWAQLLAVGAILDLGLYAMHRFSHRAAWAWRLHAIHHGAERLYWLNGERRHPLSALLMAGPGLVVVVGLGAPAEVVSAWLALLSVQLAFQHANLDYRVGPLRRWLGVAEVHRWHHKRDYEEAQVNFGEFFMLWDRLFGTFLDRPEPIGGTAVGLREDAMPLSYSRQLAWPFRKQEDPLTAAFERRLADGYAALQSNDAPRAYELFEQAHVIGQPRTRLHVRSHMALLRWGWRLGDWREVAGQLLRLPAAALFTRVWMPKGNTGGANVSAFRSMPIPADLSIHSRGTTR